MAILTQQQQAKAGGFADGRQQAREDKDGILDHGLAAARLLVWNHSDIAHGVRRD